MNSVLEVVSWRYDIQIHLLTYFPEPSLFDCAQETFCWNKLFQISTDLYTWVAMEWLDSLYWVESCWICRSRWQWWGAANGSYTCKLHTTHTHCFMALCDRLLEVLVFGCISSVWFRIQCRCTTFTFPCPAMGVFSAILSKQWKRMNMEACYI